MKLRYLRAFIVLLAGLITLIINIKMHREVTQSLLILLIVLLVFYFLGTLAVELIEKSLENEKKKRQREAALNEDNAEEDLEERLEEDLMEDSEDKELHVSFDEDEEV